VRGLAQLLASEHSATVAIPPDTQIPKDLLLAHTLLYCFPLGLTQFQKERTWIMIKKFLQDESGMETLEYAMIAGLIAAVAVAVYTTGWGTALADRLLAATNPTIP
jgi:Flp pilus assembly pilin Flp